MGTKRFWGKIYWVIMVTLSKRGTDTTNRCLQVMERLILLPMDRSLHTTITNLWITQMAFIIKITNNSNNSSPSTSTQSRRFWNRNTSRFSSSILNNNKKWVRIILLLVQVPMTPTTRRQGSKHLQSTGPVPKRRESLGKTMKNKKITKLKHLGLDSTKSQMELWSGVMQSKIKCKRLIRRRKILTTIKFFSIRWI